MVDCLVYELIHGEVSDKSMKKSFRIIFDNKPDFKVHQTTDYVEEMFRTTRYETQLKTMSTKRSTGDYSNY